MFSRFTIKLVYRTARSTLSVVALSLYLVVKTAEYLCRPVVLVEVNQILIRVEIPVIATKTVPRPEAGYISQRDRPVSFSGYMLPIFDFRNFLIFWSVDSCKYSRTLRPETNLCIRPEIDLGSSNHE